MANVNMPNGPESACIAPCQNEKTQAGAQWFPAQAQTGCPVCVVQLPWQLSGFALHIPEPDHDDKECC